MAHAASRFRAARQGGALLSVIVALVLVSMLGAAMAGLLHRGSHAQMQSYDLARAYYLAESGISYARAEGMLDTLATAGTPATVALDEREQFTVSVTSTNGVYTIEALGSTGVGSARETHQRLVRDGITVATWDPDASAPPMQEAPVDSVVEAFDDYSLSTWTTKSMSDFARMDEDSVYGAATWVRTYMSANNNMSADNEDDDLLSHYIGHEYFVFGRLDLLEQAWQANDYQIAYEVQVKMLWDYYRGYGAQGIAVHLIDNDKNFNKNQATGYQVSFMRYAAENEEGNYSSTFSSDYDGIPNSIKPPGLADHRLLVVWRISSSGNVRDWIAYKDLGSYSGLPGEDSTDWIMDYDDGISGECFRDFSTINVRVTEAYANSDKYTYIQVLRADPKSGEVRAGNARSDDINSGRKAYASELQGGTFPQWSPLNYEDWTVDGDCFTRQAATTTDPSGQLQWDGLNTNVFDGIEVLSDLGTIRVEDKPTSDGGTWVDGVWYADEWEEKRYEIGLHVTGNFNNLLLNTMYFDDFAVRFLQRDEDETLTPGVQY